MTDRGRYLLANTRAEAGQRFDALSVLFNPATFRHLERLGIAPGWRVWEVGAGSAAVPAPQRLANELKRAFRVLLAERGADLAFGRTLPRRLRAAGLAGVQSDAHFPMGGPVCSKLERATVEQIRNDLVARGLATDAQIDEHLANVASGQVDLATSPMVSAWGRRGPGIA